MGTEPSAASGTQEAILAELLSYQKKAVRHSRIISICGIALAVLLLIALVSIVPKTLAVFDHVQESLSRVDELAADAGTLIRDSTAQINSLVGDATELIDNANTVIIDNTDAITQTVRKLNAVDFEKLNKAISDLDAAIEPLVNFARMFKR
jgi:F0F1-type ATP synthase membrane subunit b/b'